MSANTVTLNVESSLDWPRELLRHGRWLRGVLLARSRDRQAIDELWQALATVVAQSPVLNDSGSVAAWLYRVAVRVALLHRRRLGRERRLQASLIEQRRTSGECTAPSPLDWMLAIERNQLVRRALATLPSKEAELLLLKYTEDWSYRELAEHLGISESAVESRLTRARSKLRAQLRGICDDVSH